jgi:hypothetical protein
LAKSRRSKKSVNNKSIKQSRKSASKEKTSRWWRAKPSSSGQTYTYNNNARTAAASARLAGRKELERDCGSTFKPDELEL